MGTATRNRKSPAEISDGTESTETKAKPIENGSAAKGRKVLGVDFAPMKIPLERRLQTIGVICWALVFFSGVVGPALLAFLIFYCEIYVAPLLYIAWIIYDRNTGNSGARIVNAVRNWRVWDYYRDYFPINLVKTADLDPKRNYLMAVHPHGIICNGVFGCFATDKLGVKELFPGIFCHLLTLELSFMVPIFREFVQSAGLCTVSKRSLKYLLSYPGGGKAAVLVPGGASESLDAHPGSYIIQLKKKKGFIKIALQNGSPLVPVFSFGEIDIYDQWKNPEGSLLRKFQNKLLKTLTFAPIIILGRGIFQYSFGLLPNRRPITVVVGEPIEVEKTPEPSPEQIDELHAKYIVALTKLFQNNREKYADAKSELIFK